MERYLQARATVIIKLSYHCSQSRTNSCVHRIKENCKELARINPSYTGVSVSLLVARYTIEVIFSH